MFDQLGDGVFRRRYRSLDFNVGVVLGEDGVLIIDTRSTHREAAELIEDLAKLTTLPVRWVVNTHYHWDHVFGNACFPGADIWGHELCRKALLERGPEMKDHARAWLSEARHADIDDVAIVAPERTFTTAASIAIGRDVELTYHGLAHTDSDILIKIPDSDVVFMGDMVEEGAPPNFGDSFPSMWPLTLRLAMEGTSGTIVPGHGDVVDRSYVESQHADLVSVAEAAESVVGGEMSVEEAVAAGPYPPEVMRSAIERELEVR